MPPSMRTEDVLPEMPVQNLFRIHAWQARSIAGVRIAFGIAWAIAAWLKWQPAFQNSFVAQITGAQDGQIPVVQVWISWWGNLVSLNPLLLARLEASMETALAILLILGLFNNLTCILGIFLSLGIWTVAEGFGGPYMPGASTDIGTAFPYILLFGLFLVVSAGRYYGLDQWLTPRLGSLAWMASGALRRKPKHDSCRWPK